MRRRRRAPAALFALSLIFTLLALTAAQSTGGTAGPVLLGRLAGALFELDRWLPRHEEDIREAAQDRIATQVTIEGLPINVAISTPAAASADARDIADAIANAAGRRLWREGRGAFDGSGATGDISLTSPVRWTISLLKHERHDPWVLVTAAGAVASLSLAFITIFASTDGLGVTARAGLVAGLVYAAACGALWVAMEVAAGAASSPADVEVARILRDCAWIGLRAGFAAGLVALAALVAVWTARREQRVHRWSGALDEPA